MNTKTKANGKIKNYCDIRKYKDTVLWGAEMAGESVPTSFHKEVEQFLKAYKRLEAKRKKGWKCG